MHARMGVWGQGQWGLQPAFFDEPLPIPPVFRHDCCVNADLVARSTNSTYNSRIINNPACGQAANFNNVHAERNCSIYTLFPTICWRVTPHTSRYAYPHSNV